MFLGGVGLKLGGEDTDMDHAEMNVCVFLWFSQAASKYEALSWSSCEVFQHILKMEK